MTFEEPDPHRDAGSDLVTELDSLGLRGATEIGRGGFAVVYRCTQVGLDREVAVKVLTGPGEQDRQRFVREQKAMGRLTGHPNIVAVLHVGQTGSGRPYLVMPYYAHGSLQDRIRHPGVLRVQDVLGIGMKLVDALGCAHRVGILHRDVKPANILFTDYGAPALTDFGIARIRGGFNTATGILTGSPAFTAPEVLGGDAPTEASDVYGLGATLFCALIGHPAFERRHGEQVMAQFLRIAADPLPDLRTHGIAAAVADVVEHAMARDPNARPTTHELGELIQQAQTARAVSVDAAPLPRDASPASASGPPTATHEPASRSTGQVPTLLASCLGREVDVTRVRGLLTTSRLVTLFGLGGVGKTTLAVAAAHELVRSFTDGVWFIELADLQEGDLLGDVVAAALGLRDQPNQPRSELIVAYLREREALLVLDNCEQLIDAAAKLVDALLIECPRLRVLVTSREVLDINGESVLAVDPLSYPDAGSEPAARSAMRYPAVELFVERTRAGVPDFALTDLNAPAVIEICARLDGLPLAIELAAARMRSMSAEQIAHSLADRYTILTRGRRGAPHRQQSLDYCVQWSYDLCTRGEQELWAQLSVFATDFDLAAAQAICGSHAHVGDFIDELGRLVDKSILVRHEQRGVVRFRLLETVRSYGQGRLSKTEHQQLRRRHADWYQQLLADAEAEWFTDQQISWIERVSRELPNIREALQYCLTDTPADALRMATNLRPMWIIRGMVSEGRRWLDLALNASPPEPTPQRIRAIRAAAQITLIVGDAAGATERVAEARNALAVRPDPAIEAEIDFIEGYGALLAGDVDRARPLCERALSATDDVETRTVTLSVMGWIAQACGERAESFAWFEKMLAVTEPLGESQLRARALTSVGGNLLYRGDLPRAERMLKDALGHAAAVDDRWTGEHCLQMLAWIAASTNDFQRFAVLAAAASALRESTGAAFMLSTRRRINLIGQAQHFHDECERRARDALGPQDYELAWLEGDALGFEESVAVAIDETS